MAKVEYKDVRPIVIAVALLLSVVTVFISDILYLYSDKSATYGGFVISMMWLVLLSEVLGRANRRLRLTGPELVIIFTAILMVTNVKAFIGTAGESINNYVDMSLTVPGQALQAGAGWDMADYWGENIPAFQFPKSEVARSIFINGMKPGEILLWNEWTIPIVFWSMFFFALIALWASMAFALLGKPWVEIENLTFPLARPNMLVTIVASDVDETTKKSGIFNLKDRYTSVFWATFVIGMMLSSIPFLSEVFPAITYLGAFAWGEQFVHLTPIAAALPGAYACGVVQIPLIALLILTPLDILVTPVVIYIIFGIIYQYVGVSTGTIAYEPGMEYLDYWAPQPSWWPPVPYAVMGFGGATFAVGVWILWSLRSRIKQILSTLWSKDIVENGLSIRFATAVGILASIVLIALFIVSGVPPLMAVIWFLMYVVFYISVARVSAVFFWHAADWYGGGGPGFSQPYAIGGTLGYWSLNPAEYPNPAANALMLNHLGESACLRWGLRCSGFGPCATINLYKLAHANEMNLKKIFATILTIGIIISPLSIAWHLYLANHAGGLINTNMPNWAPWSRQMYILYQGLWPMTQPGETLETVAIWSAVGFVFTIVCYLIRMRFSWFLINPVMIPTSLALMDWAWLNALIALVIKIISARVVGTTKVERYVVPAASGLVFGFSILLLPMMIINFFGVALPNFYSKFVP